MAALLLNGIVSSLQSHIGGGVNMCFSSVPMLLRNGKLRHVFANDLHAPNRQLLQRSYIVAVNKSTGTATAQLTECSLVSRQYRLPFWTLRVYCNVFELWATFWAFLDSHTPPVPVPQTESQAIEMSDPIYTTNKRTPFWIYVCCDCYRRSVTTR